MFVCPPNPGKVPLSLQVSPSICPEPRPPLLPTSDIRIRWCIPESQPALVLPCWEHTPPLHSCTLGLRIWRNDDPDTEGEQGHTLTEDAWDSPRWRTCRRLLSGTSQWHWNNAGKCTWEIVQFWMWDHLCLPGCLTWQSEKTRRAANWRRHAGRISRTMYLSRPAPTCTDFPQLSVWSTELWSLFEFGPLVWVGVFLLLKEEKKALLLNIENKTRFIAHCFFFRTEAEVDAVRGYFVDSARVKHHHSSHKIAFYVLQKNKGKCCFHRYSVWVQLCWSFHSHCRKCIHNTPSFTVCSANVKKKTMVSSDPVMMEKISNRQLFIILHHKKSSFFGASALFCVSLSLCWRTMATGSDWW